MQEQDFEEQFEDEEIDAAASFEIHEIIVDKGQEQLRIDKFIQNKLKDITRSKIQNWITDEKIKVNGQIVKSNYKVRPLDCIQIEVVKHPDYTTEIVPENIPLNIVYEDEAIIVINKAAGMVVHPGHGNFSGTLLNALAFHFQEQEKKMDEMPARIGLVHRIDKDTTGLILIAKTEEALTFLQKQFKDHTVHRRYVALAWGDFDEPEGRIEGNIGRNEKNRKIMAVMEDEEKGKHAVTHYKVLERLLYVSLIECRLETGRTHQIRVHTRFIGHPLFNDAAYGGDKIVKGTIFPKYKQFVANCFEILNRQALHAKELGFIHPISKEKIMFDSELPEDFATVLERWRTYTQGKV